MRNKMISWEKKKRLSGFLFVVPFVIGIFCYLLPPIINSLAYSFSDLRVTESGYTLSFVGLKHYNQLLRVDPTFRKTVLNALLTMLTNVPVTILFSFFVASLLNQKFRGRSIFRGIFFLPVILSAGIYVKLSAMDQVSEAVTAVSNAGIGSAFIKTLESIQVAAPIVNFISSTISRISDIVGMSAIPIVIFLAGFQTISPAIFEAAYMEGASKWDVFWKISFPMVSPLIMAVIIYTISDSFTNSANTVIDMVHQTNFTDFKFGLGSAMMWLYLVVVLVVVLLVYKIVNRFIVYSD